MKQIGLVIIIFLVSCKKDTNSPVVNYIKLNSVSDTLVFDMDLSSKILLESLVEDDIELNQIRIYSNTSIYSTPSDTSLFSNFVFSNFINAESNPYIINDSLVIPTNSCAGLYTINISAIDKNGNEGTGEPVYLLLTSNESPSESITFPDFIGGTPNFSAGDTIRIDGTVVDNVAVEKVYTYIFDLDNNTIANQNFLVSDTIITTWDFQTNNAQLILPTTMDAGNYTLRIDMGDNDGNLSFFLDTLIIN